MTHHDHLIQLTIDGHHVQVERGTTVLQAAAKLGIAIPTMCFKPGCTPSTSCMVCVVAMERSGALIPSCGAMAQEGMRIRTDTPQVLAARQSAIALLLSEHAGDCMGPCQRGCPAEMDIPQMLRQIASSQLDRAIATIKADIALPAILGRICPAPCEKVCRRAGHDAAVSICLLKRFVADWDLAAAKPYQPQCKPLTGNKVAIVGAGPCGLAAAYYLAVAGIASVVFDQHPQPGGMLRTIDKAVLPPEVLKAEIDNLLSLPGIEFRGNVEIGRTLSFQQLASEFDAVFVAVGKADSTALGLDATDKGIKVDARTYRMGQTTIFAGGEAIGRRRLAVRAVADGKEAAISIVQLLSGKEVTGVQERFNSRLGQLAEGEMQQYLATAETGPRRTATAGDGLSPDDAVMESKRCLGCDCLKKDACVLRDLAEKYQVRQQTYKGHRKPFTRQTTPYGLVFEQGKCILCGLCVQTARQYADQKGLAFAGRGFETEIAVPLHGLLTESLSQACAEACVKICPTGALSRLPR
ncbi:2Fe-2S iron-sulfur cluster-binding protein [Anaerohalosphaeraceae bacterium U12dextr]